MSHLKNTILGFFSIALLVGFLTSCDNEDEVLKPFVGTWETEVAPNASQIQEQKVFIFKNSSFEVEIHQGATADALVIATAVAGSITSSTDTEISAVIEGVAIGNKNYTYKAKNEALFNSMFSAGIGTMLFETFTGEYVISGTTMTLTVPVKYGSSTVDMPFTLTKK